MRKTHPWNPVILLNYAAGWFGHIYSEPNPARPADPVCIITKPSPSIPGLYSQWAGYLLVLEQFGRYVARAVNSAPESAISAWDWCCVCEAEHTGQIIHHVGFMSYTRYFRVSYSFWKGL